MRQPLPAGCGGHEGVVRALEEQLRLRDGRQVGDPRLRGLARRMQRISEVDQPRRAIARSAAAIDAMRPPYDLPAAHSGASDRSRDPRLDGRPRRHGMAAGPGIRRPASAYGKLKRSVATPCVVAAPARSRRGTDARSPVPAPCAIAATAQAPSTGAPRRRHLDGARRKCDGYALLPLDARSRAARLLRVVSPGRFADGRLGGALDALAVARRLLVGRRGLSGREDRGWAAVARSRRAPHGRGGRSCRTTVTS